MNDIGNFIEIIGLMMIAFFIGYLKGIEDCNRNNRKNGN